MPETVVCVGAVVRSGDRILLVRQSPGHPLAGQWTVPWGHLERGESAAAAAVRETREEAGVDAVVDGLLGVQELPAPWEGWIALVYLCTHAGGTLEPQDTETDAARYFSVEELDALPEPIEPWSAWLVRRVLGGNFTLARNDQTNPLYHHDAFV